MKPSNHTSKFDHLTESEALKIQCVQIYYRVEAISSIVASLLEPSPVIRLGPVGIIKFWDKKVSSHIVFVRADLINPYFEIIELIQLSRGLENEKSSLKKIIEDKWPNWKKEVKRPLLVSDLSFASKYSDPIIKKEILSAELEPYVNKVRKVFDEAVEFVKLTKDRNLAAIVLPGLRDFSKLFKFTEQMVLTEKIYPKYES